MRNFYSFDEYNIPQSVKLLFWGLYMVVFVYAVWKIFLAVPKAKRNVEIGKWIVLYFAAYAVFYCVNPDYFRYRDWMDIPSAVYWHKEEIYFYLSLFCRLLPIDYPFELFRLLVWGGALLLVYRTAKMYRAQLSPGLAVLLLFVFFSGTFCYARASLAMGVFSLGVAILMHANGSLERMFGIGLAVCSYFFHHEMMVGVAVLPSILLPFERKSNTFIMSLWVMVTAVLFLIYTNPELLSTILGDDDLAEKMETYSNQELGAIRLSTLVKYINIFYPFLLVARKFRKREGLPKAIVGIYRVTFMLLLVTVAFMAVSGTRSTFTYRVMYITIIPMSILIAYGYNQGLFKRNQLAIMLLLAVLTNSIRLINAM